MEIICPTCNAGYNIPEKKLPPSKAVAKCKKCDGSITIDPAKAASPEIAAATPSGHKPDTVQTPQVQQHSIPSAAPGDLNKIFEVYPEMQALTKDKFDLPAILTPTKKGSYKTGRNKFKIRILKAVQDRAEQILEDGEIVLRVGKGTAYYPLELFLGNGWLTMLYNHYAILATNRRLLFININHRINRSTHYLFQMPYTDIKKAKRGMLFNYLVLYRHKGKRRVFNGLKGYLNKELRTFIEEMRTAAGDVSPDNMAAEKLCPACFEPLADKLENCPQCSADFKLPQKALIRSLILPGLGDMYLGHRFLGALEMVGALIVWMVVITSIIAGGAENFVFAAILLFFFNGMDGLLTYHMAKKGYMLAKPLPAAA